MAIAVRWFSPGPKVYWRGRWFDKAFVVAMTDQERVQGYSEYWYQGSYNKGGVGASAGTHDGGAVGDKTSKGLNDRKRAASRGIIFWPRTKKQGFMIHDHGMLMWASTASSGLKAQMYSWRNGHNGLAGNGKDDSGVRSQYVHYLDWQRKAPAIKVPPNAYLDGIEKSRKYGDKVRPYNSVKLLQTALNRVFGGKDLLVDGIMGPVTVARYNGFRETNLGLQGSTGSIGAVSLKLLFKKAAMSVNVWNKLKSEGGKIQ